MIKNSMIELKEITFGKLIMRANFALLALSAPHSCDELIIFRNQRQHRTYLRI